MAPVACITVDGTRAGHRHVEEQVAAAAGDLHQPQGLPFTSAAARSQHRVGAFHGFEGDAGAIANGDALSDIEAGERVGDAAAVTNLALPRRLVGLRRVSTPFRRSSGFSKQRGIDQLDAFVGQHFHDAADQRVGVLFWQRRQQFHSRQSGRMDEKMLACFTWPAIMTSLMPSRLRISISRLELAERDPVAARRQLLDFGRRFLRGSPTATTSSPALRAVSSASSGNRPLPAIRP